MEIGVKISGFILKFLDFITKPIFWFISRGPTKQLPPIDDPLLLTSATKLADLIKKRKVTSTHVVEVFIKRIKDVNYYLNAIVEERFQRALDEAKRVDEMLDNAVNDEDKTQKIFELKPFLGVPITIKESCSLSGMSLCTGSIPRIGVKAIKDCDAVSFIRESGAIPVLVSNTPELCLSWESNNLVTGRSNNPYCLNRTCGGSSGGEAALIGSGASVFGVASDIAGSIRIPAMFNGIFGHKPTPGIISVEGHYPTSTDENFPKFLVIGPLARYSEDLSPMLKIMAGKNADLLKLDKPVNLKELKILYMMEAGQSFVMIPVEKEIQKIMLKAIEYLKNESGCKIEDTKFKEMEDSVEISVSVFFGMQDIPNVLQDENDPKKNKNLWIEILKSIFGIGKFSIHCLGFYLLHITNLFIPRWKYGYYRRRADMLKDKIEEALGENGVFLYPTFPIPAFRHNQVFVKPAGVLYTMIFNILGLPSTHVPLGLNSEGLPIGIQIVAAANQDRLCLAVAEELERGFGGWVRPPADARRDRD